METPNLLYSVSFAQESLKTLEQYKFMRIIVHRSQNNLFIYL